MAEVLGAITAGAQSLNYLLKGINLIRELRTNYENGIPVISEHLASVEEFVDIAFGIQQEAGEKSPLLESCLKDAMSFQDKLKQISVREQDGRFKRFGKVVQWSMNKKEKEKEIHQMFINLREKRSNFALSLEKHLPLIYHQISSVCDDLPKMMSSVATTEKNTSILLDFLETNQKLSFHQSQPLSNQPMIENEVGISTMNLNRIAPFFGREEVLEDIGKRLRMNDGQNRVALFGLGGVGKSAIAVEYAIRLRERSPKTSIFLIHADTVTNFEADYVKIAAQAGMLWLANDSAAVAPDSMKYTKRWLSSKESGEWLAIVDDANSQSVLCKPNSLSDFIPWSSTGSVIYTTRSKATALSLIKNPKNILEVKAMDPDDAKSLFLAKTGVDPDVDTAVVPVLLKALDYLPLAISQAGAFINLNCHSTEKYLRLYYENEDSRMELLSDEVLSKDVLDGYGNSLASVPVAHTLMVSFDMVRASNSGAENLLSLMACLSMRGIPRKLLLEAQQSNELKLTRSLGILSGYSLITEQSDGSFDMHSLVYLVIRNWLRSHRLLDHWRKVAFTTVARLFSSKEAIISDNCTSYIQQAEVVLQDTSSLMLDNAVRSALAFDCSQYLLALGRYESAETYAANAIEWCLVSEDGFNVDTLIKKAQLATVLRYEGKYQKAKRIDAEVHREMKTQLGENDQLTWVTMDNLALSLQYLGERAEAVKLQRWVLEKMSKELGPDHPKTLASRHNLALSLQYLNEFTEARELGEGTVRIKKRLLGDEHPETLLSMSNLAVVMHRSGDLEAAEEMYLKVLSGRAKVLGYEHPRTITSIFNFGTILHARGDYAEAEKKMREALVGYEKALGSRHPDTFKAMYNLSTILLTLKKYDEADSYSQQAFQGQEVALGPNHPLTKASSKVCALIRRDLEKYAPS